MTATLQRVEQEVVVGPHCPLCGGVGVLIGQREGYPLRRCECQGAVLLSFPWSEEPEYEAWYVRPGAYHEGEQAANGQSISSSRDTEHLAASRCRLRALAALGMGPGRLLDVGAGVGSFVAAAAAEGHTVTGLEPNPDMVALARSLGRNVLVGDWRTAAGRFEVITLHDVFEHLTRPWACLQHLSEVLAPGGLLVIETPEYDCPASKAHGMDWKHVRPRQHVCLYSEPAARSLFFRAGWELEALIRPCRGSIGKAVYYLARRSGEGAREC